MALAYGYDPNKRTYYGTTSDIELAKQRGIQGRFIDVSKYGEESKFKDILHAYRTGANPVILGGALAKGGINDSLYQRLIKAGARNLTRIGGKDRYEVQENLRNYISQLKRDKPFEFNYKNISYDDAKNRVASQLNPIYQQALKNIQAQKYQNQLSAGEQARARGLSHSGLAADLQNKIAIAAQSQIAQTEAEKAAKLAEMAQALVERDQARGDALRQQAFQEYMAQKQMDMDYDRFDYAKQRDQIEDKRWREQLEWEKSKFKNEDAWRRYVYNNMSATEKAQLEWAKKQWGEQKAWELFELKYNGELAKSQAQAELDFYKNFTVDEKGGGFNTKGPVPSPQSFQTHMSQAVKKYGVPASWVPALTELIRRESSFNPRAKNPKSTAYGYGQFLKSTRAAYEKKTGLDYDNPVHQIVMMAQYVKDRYGTPEKALAWWNTHKWY
jgi:Transglycosylase SLT domain